MGLKRLVLICLCSVLCLALGAKSLDEIIISAKENSPSYKNTQIAYQDGLIGLRQLEKEDKTLITVGGSVTPITKSTLTDENMLNVMPSFTLYSSDRKTKLATSMGYTMDYRNTIRSYTPTVSASHRFDLSGFDSDVLEDLNYSVSNLSVNMTYQSAVYQFEQNTISIISTLLSSLKTLESTDKSLSDLRTDLANIDSLSTVSKESITYKNLVNSINALENTKKALEQQYEDAKKNYKTFTGLEWDGIDELPDPKLELSVLSGGNSSVIISSLNIQIAEEEYKSAKATQNPRGFELGGEVAGTYDSDNTGSLDMDASLSYIADNWTVKASYGNTWLFENGNQYYPSLTISGSWTNGSLSTNAYSQSSIRDELELQKKQNAILSANNDYITALTSYTQQAQELSVKIMQWNFEKSEIDAKLSYLEDVLGTKRVLLDAGLVSQSDVDSAYFDLKQAEYDRKIVLLEGLALERDLRIFAL